MFEPVTTTRSIVVSIGVAGEAAGFCANTFDAIGRPRAAPTMKWITLDELILSPRMSFSVMAALIGARCSIPREQPPPGRGICGTSFNEDSVIGQDLFGANRGLTNSIYPNLFDSSPAAD